MAPWNIYSKVPKYWYFILILCEQLLVASAIQMWCVCVCVYIYIYIYTHTHITSVFALATNSCSHKIQGINVCLQNHLWLCTSLPKFSTSDLLYVPLEACVLQVNDALLFIPKRHKITFTDFYIKCSLLVEWPAQLNLSRWVLSHLQESATNTTLPSLFDPLTLALSILILFMKKY